MIDSRMIERALVLAAGSIGKEDKHFHLACIGVRADGTTVFSRNGRNDSRAPKHHAESRCVRKLDAGATVYVARARVDGSAGPARPCRGCETLLRARRVRRIVFTIDGSSYGVIDISAGTESVRSR
jgi:tRNA(Arg) A34 adenosine deaminase TadA